MPPVGIEPTHLSVLDFESSASTNSTTGATSGLLPDAPTVGNRFQVMKSMFDFITDHADMGSMGSPETLEGDHITYLDDHFNFSAMDRAVDAELSDLILWMSAFKDNLTRFFEVDAEVLPKALESFKRRDDPWEAAAALVEERWKAGLEEKLDGPWWAGK